MALAAPWRARKPEAGRDGRSAQLALGGSKKHQAKSAAKWSPALRHFAAKWQAYKDANGLIDFCDLIDCCLRDLRVAPKAPSVIFADEAQDLNRMQLTLIRRWGQHTDYFIVAGDDDQTIYSFAGAVPEAILEPEIPEDHKILLKQSFRVPLRVHAAANQLIQNVTRRQKKEYLPRDAEGICAETSGTWQSPEYGIFRTAMQHLERGHSVMFLAACSYMLRPIIQILRKHAIPFHNPYRRSNGFWNPLRITRRRSSVNRVLALLAAHPASGNGYREWTAGELDLWMEWLTEPAILKSGAKGLISEFSPSQSITAEDLEAIFEPSALESLTNCLNRDHRALVSWWRSRVNGAWQNRIQFAVDIAAARGPQALLERPKVTVGTIHSLRAARPMSSCFFPT